MTNFLFTSEAVAVGHPDKVSDQIADAILDACLEQDLDSRVACEVLVTTGLVILAGEITTKADIDYQAVAREAIRRIGYDDPSISFDYRSCGILVAINKQSPDIAQGVQDGEGLFKEQGAGDQGMMFGFACDETPELMPIPIMFSHYLMDEIKRVREEGELTYLRPDAKAQVSVEYNADKKPLRVDTLVLSTHHSDDVEHDQLVADMIVMAKRVIPENFIDDKTRFLINPTGRFVVGGPEADCGVTGRKIVVDTYGGVARQGGGAFSGKDPSKVDRSGAYAARYVAKNIVAAKLARRCEVQIAYAIGVAEPVSIKVDTFGTGSVGEDVLSEAAGVVFDLSPQGIIKKLNLKRPIYSGTAWGGHFGREVDDFTWERVDLVDELLKAVSSKQEGSAAGV